MARTGIDASSRRGALAIAVAFALSAGSAARAHVELEEPAPRYPRAEMKEGPCGRSGGARGETVAVYAPGETITVVFREFIDHPSHYRIAFDPDGDDDFEDPVCVENCDDNRQGTPAFAGDATGTVLMDALPDGDRETHRVQVTLPDMECERCVLQLVQVMYDKRPLTIGGNDVYYQCADIALRREASESSEDAGPESPEESDAEADAGEGPPQESDGGAAPSDERAPSPRGRDGGISPEPTPATGGCASAGGVPGGSFLALVLGLICRRRRYAPLRP